MQLKQREDELLKGQVYIDAHKNKIIDFDNMIQQLKIVTLYNQSNQSRIEELEGNEFRLTKALETRNDMFQEKSELAEQHEQLFKKIKEEAERLNKEIIENKKMLQEKTKALLQFDL